MTQSRHSAAFRLAIPACFVFSACCFAQVAHAQRPSPMKQQQKATATPSQAAAPAATSLLDKPAQPAKVTLALGKLTVQADNSSLSEILNQVSEAGGMKIEGLQTGGNGDQRVFGSYGPGVPRDVLSDLLNGSGYNVMMLGVTPAGVPRELALTLRTGGGVPNPPSHPANAMEGNEEAIQPTQYQDEQPQPPPPPLAPGMANRVKSPQEMLQELQRLHDQQQQQQQQQPSEGYSLPSDDSQPN